MVPNSLKPVRETSKQWMEPIHTTWSSLDLKVLILYLDLWWTCSSSSSFKNLAVGRGSSMKRHETKKTHFPFLLEIEVVRVFNFSCGVSHAKAQVYVLIDPPAASRFCWEGLRSPKVHVLWQPGFPQKGFDLWVFWEVRNGERIIGLFPPFINLLLISLGHPSNCQIQSEKTKQKLTSECGQLHSSTCCRELEGTHLHQSGSLAACIRTLRPFEVAWLVGKKNAAPPSLPEQQQVLFPASNKNL